MGVKGKKELRDKVIKSRMFVRERDAWSSGYEKIPVFEMLRVRILAIDTRWLSFSTFISRIKS